MWNESAKELNSIAYGVCACVCVCEVTRRENDKAKSKSGMMGHLCRSCKNGSNGVKRATTQVIDSRA